MRTLWPSGATRLGLILLAAVAVVFALAEITVRALQYPLPLWYATLDQDVAWSQTQHRVVLAGSSRIYSAVDDRALAEGLSADGEPVAVANLGQGFSSPASHALGLRRLGNLGLLHGTTVVLEAPGGLADAQDWRDPWYVPERPQWLLSVIEARDLPALWRSRSPVEDLLGFTVRTLFGGSLLMRYREDLRSALMADAAVRLGLRPRPTGSPGSVQRVVLPSQRDEVNLDRILAAAADDGQRWIAGQRTVEWKETVAASMVRTVTEAGGRVVFVEMPLSTAMAAGLQSALAQQNRASFQSAARTWGTPVVSVGLPFTDADFPDGWHLSASARARFTRALTEVWITARRTR